MTKTLFEKLSAENRAALVVFVSCGDPNIAFTEKLVGRICAAGADIIELGVPFSDPMADGPTIQAASLRALKAGTKLSDVVDMSARLRKGGVKTPFVLFSYFNPIFKYGVAKAALHSARAGIDAWLTVDVPMEESAEVVPELEKNGIEFIPLASPTTSLERTAEISGHGSGFLYYVTVAGVTGARSALPEHFADRLAQVRKVSKLPVAAGFGISTPDMAHAAAQSSDAVVVGSKFVDLIYKTHKQLGENAALDEAEKFVRGLAEKMAR